MTSSAVTSSLWSQPRFWLAQASWWVVTYAIVVAGEIATTFELFWSAGVSHYLFSFLLAVGCSSVLGSFYLALPERWLSGVKSIPLVGVACLVASGAWNTGVCLHLLLTTDYPVELTRVWAVDGIFYFARILVAWSVLFLVAVQAKRAGDLRERELRSDALAHQAELRSLRSQLNPSFLLDAIDSVSGWIGRDPERARALLWEAADLLRRTLKATRSEMSSLAETLDFEADYLRFEAMRMGDRLSHRVEVPESLRDVPTASLVIHPFVEEAVTRASRGSGAHRIEIRARSTLGRLEVDIRQTRTLGEDLSGTLVEPLERRRGQLDAAYPASATVERLEDEAWLTTRIAFDPAEYASPARPASRPDYGNVDPCGRVARAPAPAVDPSVFRQPRFWLIQIGVGLAIYVIAFARGAVYWVDDRAPIQDLARVHGLSLLLAVVCSAVLAWICGRFPEVWLTRRKALPALVGLCLLLCVPWAVGVSSVSTSSGSALVGFGLMFANDRSWGFVVLLFVGTGLFVTWTCTLLLTSIGLGLRDVRERVTRGETLAHKAQLRSLRAQLNPHFLFNALSSVVPTIGPDPASARRMLTDLKHLMRRAVETTRTEGTTLAEELDFVRQYLRCETARFGGFLSFDVLVPDALVAMPIPSMLLQPLVENAVKYGMATKASSLRVAVSAARAGERLVLEVRNTGALTPNPPRTRASEDNLEPNAGVGAGLSIVRDRVANRYPATGSFKLFAEDGWVVARVAYDPTEGVHQTSVDAAELSVATG